MRKEKVYNIIIACISFGLLLLPVYPLDTSYVFTLRVFFIAHNYPSGFALREILIFVCCCIALTFLIFNIIKDNSTIKLLTLIGSILYVVMWLIALFVEFPYRNTILVDLSHGTSIIWIVLYFAILLTIIVLTALQYLPFHRPTKAERMQAQIDELKKED